MQFSAGYPRRAGRCPPKRTSSSRCRHAPTWIDTRRSPFPPDPVTDCQELRYV